MTDSSIEFYKKAPPDGGASSFIYPATDANIAFMAEALLNGCVVGIPTETVYGLAALALDEQACRSIFSIKGRPLMDPLIVHCADLETAGKLAHINEAAVKLANEYWPGPLTLILQKRSIVPDLITAGKDTVAIRIPRHPVARSLLSRVKAPLAAPSANPFGYVSPTRSEHVSASFGADVPFILDGGPCEVGLESTIVDLSKPDQPVLLRPGAISPENIAQVLEIPVETRQIKLKETEAAKAPGTMIRHYSPMTELVLFEPGFPPRASADEAIVYLKRPDGPANINTATFWFSEDGNMDNVARALFGLLRKVDNHGFTRLHCELPPPDETGLAKAVRDRLSRAGS